MSGFRSSLKSRVSLSAVGMVLGAFAAGAASLVAGAAVGLIVIAGTAGAAEQPESFELSATVQTAADRFDSYVIDSGLSLDDCLKAAFNEEHPLVKVMSGRASFGCKRESR